MDAMKSNDLIALFKRAGARGPVSGPEKAWIVPTVSVHRLAEMLDAPLLPPADHKQADIINVAAVLLHGTFTPEELEDILARMNFWRGAPERTRHEDLRAQWPAARLLDGEGRRPPTPALPAQAP